MQSTSQLHPARARSQLGFSLIELLVGIVLAMIAVIVVMQVFQLSERSKRTTSSGDSAIMDGAIAITDLQRELRQSGTGESNLIVLGCSLLLPAPISKTLSAFVPVSINDTLIAAGDANTDTLLITYGSGNGSPEGDKVLSQVGTTQYNLQTPQATQINDFVVPAKQLRPSPCALTISKVTGKAAAAPFTITTAPGTGGTYDSIYNFGQKLVVVAYRVKGGKLQQCDFTTNDCSQDTTANWLDLLDGVVSLRAEYGRDTNSSGDGQVDVFDQTRPTTNCGWARTSAVRMALTLRNGQLETQAVTGSDAGSAPLPTWAGAAGSAPIDVSSSSTQWQQYRYKVFETVVPLRNIAWLGGQTTCVGIIN